MSKQSFTFTITKTVEVEVMEEAEVLAFQTSLPEKCLKGLNSFLKHNAGSKILRLWGENLHFKCQVLFADGSVHKIWFIEKYGWGEC